VNIFVRKKIADGAFLAEFIARCGNQTCHKSSMKMTNMTSLRNALALLALGLVPCLAATKEMTAYELVKEGNRYVGEQSKDKLVQIRSEKSIGGLSPTIWYVVFYDTTASMKATEVKFGAGKMLDVKRPFRLLEPASGGDIPLDKAKLKIDSDEAIKIATKEPLLEKLTLTATALKLERTRDGSPVWKVRVWAAKLRNPNRDVDIGEVHISATDGKVVKNDLQIKRVD